MTRKTLIMNGEKYETIRFATLGAAQRYAEKTGGKIVFYKTHEYYVA